MKKDFSNLQTEQVKEFVKSHLEKNKFFDHIKSAASKDPKMSKIDKN